MESFPEQHYANGVRKNEATSRSFKACVRILKHVRGKLLDQNTISKELMSSYFLECLVWNAPDARFANKTYREDVLAVVSQVWGDMRDASKSNDYAEVSDLRWMFRGGQRKPQDAEEFMVRAWNFLN